MLEEAIQDDATRPLILDEAAKLLPVPNGGCPRRPMSRPRLLLLGPRQWLPVPCGGCPRRPMSRRRLLRGCPGRTLVLIPHLWQDGFDFYGYLAADRFAS